MNAGLDEVFPPTPEVWAELAQHEMTGDHRFGKAVRFLEEGGTDRNLLADGSVDGNDVVFLTVVDGEEALCPFGVHPEETRAR